MVLLSLYRDSGTIWVKSNKVLAHFSCHFYNLSLCKKIEQLISFSVILKTNGTAEYWRTSVVTRGKPEIPEPCAISCLSSYIAYSSLSSDIIKETREVWNGPPMKIVTLRKKDLKVKHMVKSYQLNEYSILSFIKIISSLNQKKMAQCIATIE